MVAAQMERGAEQAVSRRYCRVSGERWAAMKEALFCRRREIGAHCLSVLLARKVLKKVGQEVAVKLEGENVSKATGRGAALSVGMLAVVLEGLGAFVADEDGSSDVVSDVSEADATDEVEVVEEDSTDASPTCRRTAITAVCISPCAAYRSKSSWWVSWSSGVDCASMGDIRRMSVIMGSIIEVRWRLRPGGGLCVYMLV